MILGIILVVVVIFLVFWFLIFIKREIDTLEEYIDKEGDFRRHDKELILQLKIEVLELQRLQEVVDRMQLRLEDSTCEVLRKRVGSLEKSMEDIKNER